MLIGAVIRAKRRLGRRLLGPKHYRHPRTLGPRTPKRMGAIDANVAVLRGVPRRLRCVFLAQHESNLHPPKGLRRMQV